MKKIFLLLTMCLGFSLITISCKNKDHKHSEETHMHEDAADEKKEKELVSHSAYQCPMNCEEGKSYVKKGSCPICKMNLKPKEVDMDSDADNMHDHDKEEHHAHTDNASHSGWIRHRTPHSSDYVGASNH